MESPVTVEAHAYGPLTRFVLARRDPRFPRDAQASVYRVGDMLIDTGGSLTADALVEALRPDPPRRIVCTHQHEDHVGGVTALRAAFGQLPVQVPAMHVPLLVDFERVTTYRALYWGNPTSIGDAEPYTPGHVFEAGGVRLEAVETPGHTPGHIALCVRAGRAAQSAFVVSGDLYTTSPLVAWYESSAPCLLRSCRALAGLAPEVTMLPTHGRVRADGRAAFERLVAEVEPACERVERAAPARGLARGSDARAAQYWALADQLFGPDDGFATVSEGEWSRACFVRSVLSPVRELPAEPIPAPTSIRP